MTGYQHFQQSMAADFVVGFYASKARPTLSCLTHLGALAYGLTGSEEVRQTAREATEATARLVYLFQRLSAGATVEAALHDFGGTKTAPPSPPHTTETGEGGWSLDREIWEAPDGSHSVALKPTIGGERVVMHAPGNSLDGTISNLQTCRKLLNVLGYEQVTL